MRKKERPMQVTREALRKRKRLEQEELKEREKDYSKRSSKRKRQGPKQEEFEEREKRTKVGGVRGKREKDHCRWQEELEKIPRQVVGGVQVLA